jgi:hypothetical protein
MLPLTAWPTPTEGFRVLAEDLHARAVFKHDEGAIRLAIHGESYDICLTDRGDDRPLAALVPLDELTPDRLTAIERLWRAMAGKRVPPDTRLTPQRRQRARQMLRAVDARHAGATYRTIAEHLFPRYESDAASWVGSAIRETTIRLARDGMNLMRGGYRALLRRPRRDR